MMNVRDRKGLFSVGLLLLAAVGGVGVTQTASAQTAVKPSHFFTLRNFTTGLCLGVQSGSTTPGTALITWDCDGTRSQLWGLGDETASGDTSGATTLVSNLVDNPSRDLFLPLVAGVLGGTDNDATPVVVWTEDTPIVPGVFHNNQGWALINASTADGLGDTCYFIANAGTNGESLFYMGVLAGNTNRGAQVVVWQDVDSPFSHPDQIWCVH